MLTDGNLAFHVRMMETVNVWVNARLLSPLHSFKIRMTISTKEENIAKYANVIHMTPCILYEMVKY